VPSRYGSPIEERKQLVGRLSRGTVLAEVANTLQQHMKEWNEFNLPQFHTAILKYIPQLYTSRLLVPPVNPAINLAVLLL
jgi:hypothetical protein